MDRRCLCTLLSLVSIAACAADRPPAQSGSDEGVDVSTGELTDLPGEPSCNAAYCTNICALQISECGAPVLGSCVGRRVRLRAAELRALHRRRLWAVRELLG